MRILMLCASVLVLSSCATIVPPPQVPSPTYLSGLTSGVIGCSPQQIQSYNIEENGQTVSANFVTYSVNNVFTWQAQCNSRVYYCSTPAPDAGDATGNANIRTVYCAPSQT
jgi:hypothetical protein